MPSYIQNVNVSPYAADETEIARKKKLAQLLQQQSLEPLQAPQGGAFASPISPLQVLAKGVQAYKGKQAETEAKTQTEELSKRQQTERQAALSAALRQGMGAEQPAPELGGGPAMPANPAGGMAQLAQSGDPSVMQMGMPALQAMQAQQKQQQEQQFRASEGAENRAAREAQANQQRQFMEQQAAAQRAQQGDMARLQASLKQPPQQRQQQVIQTEQGPMILGEDGQVRPITGPGGSQVRPPARQGGPMTATAQKELIETEEQVQGGQAALELFNQAKALNDQAMGFTGAGALASAGSLIPSALRPESVDATQNLDNILQSAALPQLKAIFGGMPTEGERKILLDVQGSSSKPPKVRAEIFKRAEDAIQRRMKFNADKAKRLREGTYFTGEGLPSLQQQQTEQPSMPQRRADDRMPSGVRVTRIQ